MKWKLPPEIKIYEALSAVADNRIEVRGNDAMVHSARSDAPYQVHYNPDRQEIMSNDKGAFWQRYVGYPAIAFLLKSGVIQYDQIYAAALSGLNWKEIKSQFGEDYERTAEHVHELLRQKGISIDGFAMEIDKIAVQIEKLDLSMYGAPAKPPAGY